MTCARMIDEDLVFAHRERALSPDHPVLRGTAQNPDVFFQARETVQSVLRRLPGHRAGGDGQVRQGRGPQYHLFDYDGAPDAERVIVIMGSGAEAAQETVDYLDRKGEKVGLLKVRLYRPFSAKHFVAALPATVKNDRRPRPHQGTGRAGEPLYLDVVTALQERLRQARRCPKCRSAAATVSPPRNSRRRWSRPSSTT